MEDLDVKPAHFRVAQDEGFDLRAILFGAEGDPPRLAEAEAETPEAVAAAVFARLENA